LGLVLEKFFGEQGLDFLLAEAEVEGLDDELLNGRADLAAAGVHPEGGRLMGDEAADAAAGFDKAGFFEILVHFDDGERVDVELCRELADGRERSAVRELAGKDALLKLLLKLQVKRDTAGGVEEKHAVVLQ